MRNLEVKLLVVFVAVVMVGWGLYSVDYTDYKADITADADGVDVELSGFSTADYQYLLLSGADVPDELYYYLDDSMAAEVTTYKQSHFFDVLDSLLDVRHAGHGVRMDAQQLETMMASGNGAGKGVVFCSGAIPYNLYTGVTPILHDWVMGGGTVYWMGTHMGKQVSMPDGTLSKNNPSQFFPEGSIADGKEDRFAYNQSEWSMYLGMTQARCTTGLNVNYPGLDAVSLGMTDDEGYSEMAECDFGNGRIYVAGYNYSMDDSTLVFFTMADAITSGIDHDTVRICSGTGNKGHSSVTVHIEASVQPGDLLRFSIGVPYVSWAVTEEF